MLKHGKDSVVTLVIDASCLGQVLIIKLLKSFPKSNEMEFAVL